MFLFRVETPTGHYGLPQQTETLRTAPTLPIASVTIVRGFLESMVGADFETFDGEFAFGYIRPPGGRGKLLRKANIEASGIKWENFRPIHIETLFDLAYAVGVRGPWEKRVRDAFEGNVSRYGNLYLGESSDLVTWMAEFDGNPTSIQWVVPGTQMILPVRTGHKKARIDTQYQRFDLRGGDPHWFTGKEGM